MKKYLSVVEHNHHLLLPLPSLSPHVFLQLHRLFHVQQILFSVMIAWLSQCDEKRAYPQIAMFACKGINVYIY